MINKQFIAILCFCILLSTAQSNNPYILTCELVDQFDETYPEFGIEQCVQEMQQVEDTLETLRVTHKFQKVKDDNLKIPIKNMKMLAEQIPKCKELVDIVITLDNPTFSINAEDLEYFTDSFKNLEKLLILELNFNNQNIILDADSEQINLLQKMFDGDNQWRINKLNLQFFGSIITKNLEQVLENLRGLESLDLNFGGYEKSSIIGNYEFINENTFANQYKLEYLNLEFPYSYNINPIQIHKAVNVNNRLKYLDINLSNTILQEIYEEPLDLPLLNGLHYIFENTQFLEQDYLKKLKNALKNLKNLNQFEINLNYNQSQTIFQDIANILNNIPYLENMYELEISVVNYQQQEIYEFLYVPIQKMVKLRDLILDIRQDNQSYQCKNMEKFPEMLENKDDLDTFYLRESVNICEGEDTKNYEYFTQGFNKLTDLSETELCITDNKHIIQNLFKNNTYLKFIILTVYNIIQPNQDYLDQLFQQQQLLAVLELTWKFQSSKSQQYYPSITSKSKFFQSMQKLLINQENLISLQLVFISEGLVKNDEIFNMDYLGDMLKQTSGYYLESLFLIIKSKKTLKLDMNTLQGAFQNMEDIYSIILVISGKDLTLSDINFTKNAFDNNNRLGSLTLDFANTGLVDLSPLEHSFKKLKYLEYLFLILNSNTNVKSISFLENAFKNNLLIRFLVLNLKNIQGLESYQPFEYAFKNNIELEYLWITITVNNELDIQIFNTMLNPLYNRVTSFKLNDLIQNVENNLVYMKSKNMKFYFENGAKQKVVTCQNFQSPCQNCSQKEGQCTSCLNNKSGKNCDQCDTGYYEDFISKQCKSCKIHNNYCEKCSKKVCTACKSGYKIDTENNECLKNENQKSDTGLIIGLSVGGGILVLVIGGLTFYYLKKKKIQKNQQELNQGQDQEQDSYQESLLE